VSIGKTSLGELPLGEVAVSTTFDRVLGPVRLGAGPEASYFRISRARREETIDAIGLGFRARLSVDIVHFEDEKNALGNPSGLYLAVSPDSEWQTGTRKLFRAGPSSGMRTRPSACGSEREE
jgi:hypothetical protein